MTKIVTIISTTLLMVGVLFIEQLQAQAPSKMSYQAVVRDADGNLVIDKMVSMQLSILQDGVEGTAVFVETQTPETNANGLISIEIGSGTVSSGDFSSIDWANHTFFIKTEVDLDGGTAYSITGTSQFLSVPYALYAKSAGNTFSGSYNDLTDVPANTSFDGKFTSLTDLPTGLNDGDDDTQLTEAQVDAFAANNGYLTTEVDGSTTNEIELPTQDGNSGKVLTTDGTDPIWNTVSFNDLTDVPASVSFDGTFSSLSGVPTGLSDGDDNTQLNEAEVDAFAANNGYLTAEVDASTTNEIQDLQLSGNNLTITNNGSATTIDLSAYLDNTNTQLNETQVDAFAANNGYLTAEVDGSITNEIELPSHTGNAGKVLGTNGTSPSWVNQTVDTNTQLNESQVDAFANNNGYLTSFTEVDGSITNEIELPSHTGNAGKVLETNGTSPSWVNQTVDTNTQLNESQVDAFTNNNGYLTSFTEVDGSITNEIELPSQTGQSGKYLTTNGTSPSWSTVAGGSPTVRTISGNTTLVNTDEIVFINGAFTASFPPSPTDGMRLTLCATNTSAAYNGNGKAVYIAGSNNPNITFSATDTNMYQFYYSSAMDAWIGTF